MTKKIIVYGTTWCPDCIKVRKFLDRNGIPFEWIDIGKVREARVIVEEINNGFRSVPTILWPDGSHLVEPSIQELKTKIQNYQ
ncbi:glutaredoxin domain-containing protein [Chloroflexota bacterium]